MNVRGWIIALGLSASAAPLAAQVPGLDIDVRIGVSSSSLSKTPKGFEDSNSELGWFLGGDVRFGQFFFIQPGLYYQHQSVDLENSAESDGIGISSIMLPVQAGLNVDLKLFEAELGLGPTFTFNTGVGDNAFGIEEGDLNGTRVGALLSAKVKVIGINGWLAYQVDATEAIKGGGAKLNQWMLGIGLNF